MSYFQKLCYEINDVAIHTNTKYKLQCIRRMWHSTEFANKWMSNLRTSRRFSHSIIFSPIVCPSRPHIMGTRGAEDLAIGNSTIILSVTDSVFHIFILVLTISSVAPTIVFLPSVASPLIAEIFTRYIFLPSISVYRADVSLSPSIMVISCVLNFC